VNVTPNERVTYRLAYEDEHILVIEKRARLVTAPGVGHEDDTLLNGLVATHGTPLRNLGTSRDWGLLHRLDKATSGLLVVALTPPAYDGLREAFESRAVRKFYWAVCRSTPNKPSGVIRKPVVEEVKRATRYTSTKTARVGASGKAALTAYRALQSSGSACLIEARTVTGRLHQVRVHLDSIGATVLGDDLYGPKIARMSSPRLALHAHRIAFLHPVTGEEIDQRSMFPRDLRGMLKRMRLTRPDLESADDLSADGVSADGCEEIAGETVGDEEA
jgi:23S rRNA pseudouridine1911/1915/1917 synthase